MRSGVSSHSAFVFRATPRARAQCERDGLHSPGSSRHGPFWLGEAVRWHSRLLCADDRHLQRRARATSTNRNAPGRSAITAGPFPIVRGHALPPLCFVFHRGLGGTEGDKDGLDGLSTPGSAARASASASAVRLSYADLPWSRNAQRWIGQSFRRYSALSACPTGTLPCDKKRRRARARYDRKEGLRSLPRDDGGLSKGNEPPYAGEHRRP